MRRIALTVTGVVQGVGFRPFVYALARELGVVGFVGNDSSGVFIEAQGDPLVIAQFVARIRTDAPTLAQIDDVIVQERSPLAEGDFVIVMSHDQSRAQTTNVPPDVATCGDCLAELYDPQTRWFRYPFVSCTNCGPRITMVTGLPYDRPFTTMADFALCEDCRREYDDPTNRRFHAQSTACAACGPHLFFRSGEDPTTTVDGEDALRAAISMLLRGEIVAVKGIGGYHLAVDAENPHAVARLRRAKRRSDKPFAIMVNDVETAHGLVVLSDETTALLNSLAAPIVLAPLAENDHARAVGDGAAPNNGSLGVMLASSALHHLLFTTVDHVSGASLTTLIMTSGNLSSEPLCTDVEEAQRRLGNIADGWLHHNRRISMACDDSVVRVVNAAPMPIRRSRGYAPLPIRLPLHSSPALAVGGELKTTICVAEGHRAVMSQHIGDTENLETLALLGRTAEIIADITRISPRVVVADAHPGYLSARWARTYAEAVGASFHTVQHHHAHVASLLVEHGVEPDQAVLGVAFDGTGYGTDGSIWGGEFLLGSYSSVTRVGHLKPIALPGGDAAIRRPLRSALAHLSGASIRWSEAAAVMANSDQVERGVIQRMIDTGTSCTPTTSVGRLFDAVSSILGVCHDASYEGQAAIELEAVARGSSGHDASWRMDVVETDDGLVLDPGSLLRSAVASLGAGGDAAAAAYAFHSALADGVLEVARRVRDVRGVSLVGLTGGVFQNALLCELVSGKLTDRGFTVLTHRVVPPNDGGLALGQIAVAAANEGGA